MKAIGFLGGCYGDLIMCYKAVQSFRTRYPNVHLTFAIGDRYKEIEPLFFKQPGIDDVHIWDSYDKDWPSQKDIDYLQLQNFDMIFNSMARHKDDFWYLHRHQTQEVCHMMGLPILEDTKINLHRWFNLDASFRDCVCIAGITSFGSKKSLSIKKLMAIANFVRDCGYHPIQLCAPQDPRIPGVERYTGTYFEAMRGMLSSKLLVAADTGSNWVASGYNHPVVGVYGYEFYPGATTSKNWQAKNNNAIYLENNHAENVPDEEIFAAIKNQLK